MVDAYEFYCPVCKGTFDIDEDDDLCWADDVRDESTTPCPGCKAPLIVTTSREVYFTAKEPSQ